MTIQPYSLRASRKSLKQSIAFPVIFLPLQVCRLPFVLYCLLII